MHARKWEIVRYEVATSRNHSEAFNSSSNGSLQARFVQANQSSKGAGPSDDGARPDSRNTSPVWFSLNSILRPVLLLRIIIVRWLTGTFHTSGALMHRREASVCPPSMRTGSSWWCLWELLDSEKEVWGRNRALSDVAGCAFCSTKIGTFLSPYIEHSYSLFTHAQNTLQQ